MAVWFVLGVGLGIPLIVLATWMLQWHRMRHPACVPPATGLQANAHASEDCFMAIFHAAPVAIIISRLSDGQIIDMNAAFSELAGYTREEVVGRTSQELHLWGDPVQVIQRIKQDRYCDSQETQIRNKSGHLHDILMSVSLLQIAGEGHMLIMAMDVGERKHARKMEHLAHHDTLTNLPNRLFLHARLQQALDRNTAGSGQHALMFIDLDHFKQVNDVFGHAAGDELLRLVSQRLKGRLRPVDTLARVGGDEFMVLLERLGHARQAEAIAADLIRQVSLPFSLSNGSEVRIGASIGINVFTGSAHDLDLLVQQADAALYTAKRAGRNAVRVYASLGSSGEREPVVASRSADNPREVLAPLVSVDSGLNH